MQCLIREFQVKFNVEFKMTLSNEEYFYLKRVQVIPNQNEKIPWAVRFYMYVVN